MYVIRKEFQASCMHHLLGLPEDHPCGRVHGHNYVIVVELRSETLNKIGFVKDYGELNVIKEWIDKTMDHRALNDVFSFNPTAENLAKHLYERFVMLLGTDGMFLNAVEVSETPKTNSRFYKTYNEHTTD